MRRLSTGTFVWGIGGVLTLGREGLAYLYSEKNRLVDLFYALHNR